MARRNRVAPDRAWLATGGADSLNFVSGTTLAAADLITDMSDIDALESLTKQRSDRYLERWLFWYRLTYFNADSGISIRERGVGIRIGSIEVPEGELFADAPEVVRQTELGFIEGLDCWAHVVAENVVQAHSPIPPAFNGAELVTDAGPGTSTGYPVPQTWGMFDVSPRLRLSTELVLAVAWGPLSGTDTGTTPAYGIEWYSKQLWRKARVQ